MPSGFLYGESSPRQRFQETGKIYFGMSSRPSRNAFRFYKLAVKKKLENPLGRAIYLASRACNTQSVAIEDKFVIEALRKIKDSTALRWLAHWENGGSLKALRYGQEDWAIMRFKESCQHVMAVDLKTHEEIRCNISNCHEHHRWPCDPLPEEMPYWMRDPKSQWKWGVLHAC